MVDFNESFNRILKKQIAKERCKQKRTIDTGNSEVGRALVVGPQQEVMAAPPDGTFAVRIYKARPGAVKGRGRLGGIRK